jgi:hypothetical protein
MGSSFQDGHLELTIRIEACSHGALFLVCCNTAGDVLERREPPCRANGLTASLQSYLRRIGGRERRGTGSQGRDNHLRYNCVLTIWSLGGNLLDQPLNLDVNGWIKDESGNLKSLVELLCRVEPIHGQHHSMEATLPVVQCTRLAQLVAQLLPVRAKGFQPI